MACTSASKKQPDGNDDGSVVTSLLVPIGVENEVTNSGDVPSTTMGSIPSRPVTTVDELGGDDEPSLLPKKDQSTTSTIAPTTTQQQVVVPTTTIPYKVQTYEPDEQPAGPNTYEPSA
jgi:hypothetical protein